jgi:VCBS repeat-containing protein
LVVDAASGVLANDTDADGDPLTAALVSGPANGTLVLNADGSFSYTPSADFSGSDSFTYTASDGTLTTDPITVTITVDPVNDAPIAVADEYTVAENETLDVALPGVLANDTDADGDVLAATLVSGPANGTLTLNSDGSFSYTPNMGFDGTDSFTYTAGDGVATSEATVTITVTNVNGDPMASPDEYATTQDTPITVDAPGVLGNDSDPDGDPLTAVLVSGPANGTLALNSDGSFNYTPTTGFSGSDSFVYLATDGSAESEATVTITVNPFQSAPIVFDDAYSTGEDVALTADIALGVLANDFDTAGGTLTATLVTGPDNGTLTLNADGSFTYAPEADWHGTATFTYEASSSAGGSVQATATIVVQPLNDMPVAVNDSFNVMLDTELASSVLDNDSDIDGDALTANLLLGPSHGTLTLNSDGTFSYTPDEGYNGGDQFYYQLSDGMANSNVALVSLTVGPIAENQFPASAEDSYSVQSGQTLNVATPGVLGNDSDAEGDPLTAELVTGPANGVLVLNADGSFSYTPNEGFIGSDTFTYQANDGLGLGNVATVTLTVTPEGTTLPIAAEDDAYAVAAETTLSVDLPGVLANDVDAEADPLTATLVEGPAHGSLTLMADGSFSYTPAIGFAGSDSFTYQAGDGTNVSNIATVTIEVGSADNARPSAGNDSYTVESGSTLDVPADQGVLLDDSDPDGDAIAAALFSAPLHGTVTLAEDGSFSYTPDAGYVGLDSFLYRVFDGELHSALAAVTIHVIPSSSTTPDETPLPGEDEECGDEGLLAMLADEGEIDHGAIDDVMGEGDWLV